MFYEDVFQALNRARVRYLVVGGGAVVLRGSDRTTHDLDLMLDFDEKNLARAMQALERLGFQPKVPVKLMDFVRAENRERWKREKGMVVFGLLNRHDPLVSVDVMVDHPVEFTRAYLRRETIRQGGLSIPLAGIPDMLRMKRLASREQDLYDIAFLEGVERHRKARKRSR